MPDCTSFLNQLVAVAGSADSLPVSLILIDAPQPLALSPAPGVIAVSGRLLELLPHEGEAFFMLAHEVGHTELNHHEQALDEGFTFWSSPRRQLELEADTFALQRLTAAGYPPTYGVSALRRAYGSATLAHRSSATDYPSLHERIDALTLQITRSDSGTLRGLLEHRQYQACRAALKTASSHGSAAHTGRRL